MQKVSDLGQGKHVTNIEESSQIVIVEDGIL